MLLISVAATFLANQLNIDFYVDFTLLSIAVIFPLVFAIRGSFRRREKAIEHLSQFRSSIFSMLYIVNSNRKMSFEQKTTISDTLYDIGDKMINYLQASNDDLTEVDKMTNEIYYCINNSGSTIPGNVRDRVFRIMEHMIEAMDNLHGIHMHRTPISLKAYCIVFIYLFPLIYAPTLIHSIGQEAPYWAPYFVVVLTEFILISLYNIQDQLEYPFDDKGLDDIKLELYRINRSGKLVIKEDPKPVEKPQEEEPAPLQIEEQSSENVLAEKVEEKPNVDSSDAKEE